MDQDGEAGEQNAKTGPLHRVLDSALALARNRLELFAVELRDEKLRASRLLLLGALALGFGVGGVLLGLGMVALLFWNWLGYAGLALLCSLAVLGCAVIVRKLQVELIAENPPFADTIEEFRKDRECLRN